MTETDQEKMDRVLKRMLETPPQPHKPKEGKADERDGKQARSDN